jgi:hypothetical protein
MESPKLTMVIFSLGPFKVRNSVSEYAAPFSSKRFLPRRNDYPDTGKDKTSTIKISSLEQTVTNFITIFDSQTPM